MGLIVFPVFLTEGKEREWRPGNEEIELVRCLGRPVKREFYLSLVVYSFHLHFIPPAWFRFRFLFRYGVMAAVLFCLRLSTSYKAFNATTALKEEIIAV